MREGIFKEEFTRRLKQKIIGLHEVHLAVCKRKSALFAFYVDDVYESIIPPPIRVLPKAHGFITGIISHRGRIVPVLEIKDFAPVPEVEIRKVRMVLIANSSFIAGILINGYPFFITVNEDELQNAGAIFPRHQEFLRGVVKRDGEVIPVINVSHIFKKVRLTIEGK